MKPETITRHADENVGGFASPNGVGSIAGSRARSGLVPFLPDGVAEGVEVDVISVPLERETASAEEERRSLTGTDGSPIRAMKDVRIDVSPLIALSSGSHQIRTPSGILLLLLGAS